MFKRHEKTFGVTLLAGLLALASPALAESRIEREFDLGSCGRFALDSDNGSVVVRGGSGSTARVQITSRTDDLEKYYTMEFSHSGGDLTVTVNKKGKLTSWFGSWNKNLRFEIDLPSGCEIDIDTSGGSIDVADIHGKSRLDTSGGSIQASDMGADVIADTSGGSIEIDGVDGSVNADTSGGSIEVRDVRGNVRADTSGGSIRISEVDGSIVADTSGGGIRIEGAGGHVRADTSGGGVTVEFTRGNSAGGEISTSGGGVTVRLDPGANLEVDASSSGGSVSSDVPITVRGQVSRTSLQGKLGAGGNRLKLRSSGGPVRIESH